ncbi:ABC transporter permease [Actinocorallia sp. A-T 12471]|uniref:ABC transporter permease n=1 Tax=Actinocorallia sp. A-T 12471 TaxID=3089813 RepID=UPI0029CE9918|nr:ABC transporter permease [Actinocorallia sp. A-T 12471]MDX6742410.1 ABC transporter permease [Actinocorallia sp. A-T 12471]
MTVSEKAPPREAARGPRRPVPESVAQYTGVLAVLGLLVVVLAVTQEQFLSPANFANIAETNSVLLLVSVGLTFVLLTGGIDLSVGAMMGFSAIICWKLLGPLPAPAALLLAVLAALVVGALTNGLLIGVSGLSFLVVTIGTSSLLHGLAQIWSSGQSQSVYEHGFLVTLGSGRIAGIPYTVLIAAGVFVAALLVLRYTGFGRMVYAVGGNPEAARLAGINVAGIRVAVYTLCAALAGLAGVVAASRTTSASPDTGIGLELTAGAAVLLGGTSFMGGRGSLLGTLLGVMFLGVLQNGVTLAGVSPFWSNVVSGVVLVVAIGLDRIRTGKAMT